MTMATSIFFILFLLVLVLVVSTTTSVAALLRGTFITTKRTSGINSINEKRFPYLASSNELSRPSLVRLSASSTSDEDEQPVDNNNDDDSESEAVADTRQQLKDEILSLSQKTSRGFQATRQEREKIRHLIYELSTYDPTDEPAKFYYKSLLDASDTFPATSLCGKWTLIYTDAPDITALDTSNNPFATAELGRIGQECQPPYIKNVIEWKRPSWAAGLPLLSGDDENVRVLQKVVVEASATPEKPKLVKLELSGLQIETDNDDNYSGGDSSWQDKIRRKGLVAGLLSSNGPVINLSGPINVPFGEFEVLYLDKDLRAIKTGQNFLAVNVRCNNNTGNEQWF